MESNNSEITRTATMAIGVLAVLAATMATPAQARPQDATWNGLIVAPEARCSPYESSDYRYSQSVEDRIVRSLGGVYGPYTGRWFASKRETDIEPIVARSEAHDSRLCRADQATRRRFSEDLRNLTLAAPTVNRHQKRDHDAAGWLPPMNRCWFASRVIDVKRAYGLTVDRRERDVLARTLAGCEATEIDMTPRGTVGAAPAPPSPTTANAGCGTDALALYDDNGNGRITCAEARRHGIAPAPRSHPAYRSIPSGLPAQWWSCTLTHASDKATITTCVTTSAGSASLRRRSATAAASFRALVAHGEFTLLIPNQSTLGSSWKNPLSRSVFSRDRETETYHVRPARDLRGQ